LTESSEKHAPQKLLTLACCKSAISELLSKYDLFNTENLIEQHNSNFKTKYWHQPNKKKTKFLQYLPQCSAA